MAPGTLKGTVATAALFAVVNVMMVACALAQQPAKLPTVAVLVARAAPTEPCGASRQASSLPCFMDAMRELGYVDGKNVRFEFRFAAGNYNNLPALATELVRLRPDVIYTAGGPGVTAAAKATTTIPIIVGPAGEETLLRIAGDFARPTGNVTGFTLTSVEQELKCLQYLKELAPRTTRVALLLNPDNPAYRDYPGVLAPAAARMGVTLIGVAARNSAELPQAFAAITASGANAIYFIDDSALAVPTTRQQVSEWALKRKLPLVSTNTEVASDGGLLSFGTSLDALTRRAAAYVDKVLKGAKPADLPVERPSKFILSMNVKTAAALGLAIPQSVLSRADEVIR